MSKLLLSIRRKLLAQNRWYVAGCALLALIAIIRGLFLASPHFPVFDEVHFPYFAQRYLAGQPFFDIHPPLAKGLIALSEWLLGYNIHADYQMAALGAGAADYFTRIIPTILGAYSLSWRFMPYLFGMGLLMVLWQLGWRITKSWQGAFFVLLVSGVDSLLFVYGRTGLMDGIMYFFVFASFLSCVVALEQKKVAKQVGLLLLAGVLAGMGMSVKWLGLAALLLCFFWLITHVKKILMPYSLIAVLLALVLAGGVYLTSFVGEGNNWHQLSIDIGQEFHSFWDGLYQWHQQSFLFNKNLKDTHPYGSSWWSWPLMLRPMLYYYQQIDPNTFTLARDVVTQDPLSVCVNNNSCWVSMIAALGNPFIWWSGCVSFLFTLLFVWPKKSWQWALLLSSIVMYLPWMFIGRVSFLYYFMGVAIVWQILLALNLWEWYKRPSGKWVVPILFAAAILWFVMAYPLLTAIPVPANYIPVVLWFASWRG